MVCRPLSCKPVGKETTQNIMACPTAKKLVTAQEVSGSQLWKLPGDVDTVKPVIR